jgi:hypothetical protein
MVKRVLYPAAEAPDNPAKPAGEGLGTVERSVKPTLTDTTPVVPAEARPSWR